MRKALLTGSTLILVLMALGLAVSRGGDGSPLAKQVAQSNPLGIAGSNAEGGGENGDDISAQEAPASIHNNYTAADSYGGDGEQYFVPGSNDADQARQSNLPATGGISDSNTGAPALTGESGASGSGSPAGQSLDGRKIIRTATLEIIVDDVASVVQKIETAAVTNSGFVSASSLTVETVPQPVSSEEDEEPPVQRQRATVTIRVPAEAYASVMSHLRGLATEVRSESSNASEVTEEYTDLQARLRNLTASEERYLELLGRAVSIPDILQVQDRLNSVRLEIEQVQGRIQVLDDLTELATITIDVALPPLAVEEPKTATQPSWAREAWDDAWQASEEALETLGVAAITAGVILVWILVPGSALLAGWWVIGNLRARKPAA